MMSIGTFLGIVSMIFAGFSSYENKRSNDINRHYNQSAEFRDKSKETVVAIKEFSKRVIPVLSQEHISLDQSIRLITYINRWSVYIDENIVDKEMIKSFLGPYLEYISNTLGYTILILNKRHPKEITGYINMMDNFRINPL